MGIMNLRCMPSQRLWSFTDAKGDLTTPSSEQKPGRPLTRSLPHSRLRSWASGQNEVSATAAVASYLPADASHPVPSPMGAEMLEMDMDDIGISTSVSSDTGTTANMAFLDTLAGWDMDFLSADKSSSSSSSNLCHLEESVAVRTDSGSAGSSESAAAAAAMGSDGSSRLCTGDGRGWGTRQAGNHLEAYSEKLTILSSRILHSAHLIACPGSPTLTLLEATSTLIAIIDGLEKYYAASKAGVPQAVVGGLRLGAGNVAPRSCEERREQLRKAGDDDVVQEGLVVDPSDRRASASPPSAQGSRGILHVAKGLLDDVKSQHASLRQEIGSLQRLVEQSRGL
ncbi:hypothetical protein LZ31DRAFT_634503 [Colletotrichum somersetense]|nr:hypothetical protein LZ31DRAFT_634503 [Colletotrichum somersetense]